MPKISRSKTEFHSKASERYTAVEIEYEDGNRWDGVVPIEYPRTAVYCEDDNEIDAYLNRVAPYCHPGRLALWLEEQGEFWKASPRSKVTKSVFDALATMEWTCTSHGLAANTNIASRYKALKVMGYAIATRSNCWCDICRNKRTFIRLLPLPRMGISGYETWSMRLRTRIIKQLGAYDAYEAKKASPYSLLPDHKFPEVRWDGATKRASLEDLTDGEIKRDFQLLTNLRNQQKREVCRKCLQTNTRQPIYGINKFAFGDERWPVDIPKRGKAAEAGCVGCGWYDIENWRRGLFPAASTMPIVDDADEAADYGETESER